MPGDTSRPCPGCLSPKGRVIGEARGFTLRSCAFCRTTFVSALPEPGSATDYSGYYDAGNLTVPPVVGGRLAKTVASFEDRRDLNRWLDVGCGAGTLVEIAAGRGWEATGTEVSEAPVRLLRERGFDVLHGELIDLDLPQGGFDVVSMIEVVEHLAEPDKMLEEVARLLRPGGALYLTTPNARGASARILGMRWSVLAPPEHLQLFSLSGIRTALVRCGLVVVKTRTHAVNPAELVRALRSSEVSGGERVESGYRLNAALSSTPLGELVRGVSNAVLSTTRLGDSIKVVAERPGS
jgi:2-polyprenyl-3-methyl-5-hydroxy-6-metoxy-1,4-benzoquinol methylase